MPGPSGSSGTSGCTPITLRVIVGAFVIAMLSGVVALTAAGAMFVPAPVSTSRKPERLATWIDVSPESAAAIVTVCPER